MTSSENHLLVLEISCGRNVNEEVHVDLGDTPDEVAKAFIERHRLKPKTMGKVSEHIRHCLEAYLSEHPRERVLHEAALAERKGLTRQSESFRPTDRSTVTSRDSVSTSRSSNESSYADPSQRYNQLKSAWSAETMKSRANNSAG